MAIVEGLFTVPMEIYSERLSCYFILIAKGTCNQTDADSSQAFGEYHWQRRQTKHALAEDHGSFPTKHIRNDPGRNLEQ